MLDHIRKIISVKKFNKMVEDTNHVSDADLETLLDYVRSKPKKAAKLKQLILDVTSNTHQGHSIEMSGLWVHIKKPDGYIALSVLHDFSDSGRVYNLSKLVALYNTKLFEETKTRYCRIINLGDVFLFIPTDYSLRTIDPRTITKEQLAECILRGFE